MLEIVWYFLPVGEIYLEFLCYYNRIVYMFCSFYLILYIIWFQFSLSLSPFYYFDYYEHQYFTSVLFHMFSFIKIALFGSYSWMSHPGPSLKVVQLRRLFDWTNMASALPQFFGAARHPCFEVSDIKAAYFDRVVLLQRGWLWASFTKVRALYFS